MALPSPDAPEAPDALGQRIRYIREKHDLTLSAIAGIMGGVDRAVVSRILEGRTRQVDVRYIEALARRFRVTTDWLLGLSDDCREGWVRDAVGVAGRATSHDEALGEPLPRPGPARPTEATPRRRRGSGGARRASESR